MKLLDTTVPNWFCPSAVIVEHTGSFKKNRRQYYRSSVNTFIFL